MSTTKFHTHTNISQNYSFAFLNNVNNNSVPNFDKEQRIKRHDRLCGELHFSTCKEMGVKENKGWYDHVTKLVEKIMKLR
jgi:hypothetical protein